MFSISGNANMLFAGCWWKKRQSTDLPEAPAFSSPAPASSSDAARGEKEARGKTDQNAQFPLSERYPHLVFALMLPVSPAPDCDSQAEVRVIESPRNMAKLKEQIGQFPQDQLLVLLVVQDVHPSMRVDRETVAQALGISSSRVRQKASFYLNDKTVQVAPYINGGLFARVVPIARPDAQGLPDSVLEQYPVLNQLEMGKLSRGKVIQYVVIEPAKPDTSRIEQPPPSGIGPFRWALPPERQSPTESPDDLAATA